MEEVGTYFQVGEKFPMFEGSLKKMKNQDGGNFEALESGNGYLMSIYLNKPHPKEISIIRTKTIYVRLVEEGEFVLPIIKFGNTTIIFELSLDPTLYDDARALQFKESSNMMLIALIDSSTGKIAALRQANLPLKMIQNCSEKWARAFLDSEYSKQYSNWYLKMRQVPLERLWQRGTYVGKMGESYNLDEIYFKSDSQHYQK